MLELQIPSKDAFVTEIYLHDIQEKPYYKAPELVDVILELTTAILEEIDIYTPSQLDDMILDVSLTLASEKRDDRSGKHWKHITLDVETQGRICKLAEIEMNLMALEERRMEITLVGLRQEKRKRDCFRGSRRGLRALGKKLGTLLKK